MKKPAAVMNAFIRWAGGVLRAVPTQVTRGARAAGRAIWRLPTGVKIGMIPGAAVIAAIISILASALQPRGLEAHANPPELKRFVENAEIPAMSVSFNGSAAKIELVGKRLETGVKIAPEIDGSWIWSDDATLTFFPSGDWEPGREYGVTMEKGIFSPRVSLKGYKVSFKAPAFTGRIFANELYIDPQNPGVKRVTATVYFSHPVNSAELESSINFAFPFTVRYNAFRSEAYFVSDPIPVPESSYNTELRIGRNVHSALGGNGIPEMKTAIRIYGKYDYAVLTGVELGMVRDEDYRYRHIIVVNTNLGVRAEDAARCFEALLLPKDRPASPGTPEQKDHRWTEKEIDAHVLADSTPVKISAIPTEDEYSRQISLSYDAPSARYVRVVMKRQIEALGGYVIKPGWTANLQVPRIPRQLSIMGEGSLLSMSGEKKVSLYSNDLDAVQFEVGRIIPDQVNNLVTQLGGDLRSISPGRNWDFGLENLSAIYTETRRLLKLEPGEIQYFSFDFSSYLERQTDPRLRYGLFFFRVSDYNAADKTGGSLSASRLILVTDLGVLVKMDSASGRDIFVQSIHTGLPVADATVEVVGKNGLPVISRATGGDGHVPIPALDGFTREKTPVAFVVTRGEDMSFLPVGGASSFLNFSRFDIGGVRGASDPGFIDAYLFSDRGIYRPGDPMSFGIVVKAGDWSKSLDGLPLQLSLEDPRGLEIQGKKLSLSASGFEPYSCSTPDTAQTGKYTLDLYLARDDEERRLLGSVSVKVEEFRPDRLSIRPYFEGYTGKAWVSPNDLTAVVSLMNLYGTPAAGNDVEARITLSPMAFHFEQFPGYYFFDPLATSNSYTEQLASAVTDADGQARFPIDLGRFDRASFMLTFAADAYEKQGGRGVETEASIQVSPLSSVVGYRADGNLSYIARGSERRVHFISVGPDRTPVPVSGLTMDISENRYVSVLEKSPDGLYRYRSVEKKIALRQTPFSISRDGYSLKLPTDSPGDFEIAILDKTGAKLASLRYTVAGAGNLARSLERNAELQIRLDRSDYAAGDSIQLDIRAPYTGAGLITIERDRVYAWKWFTADTTATVQSIRIPSELEGSAYVNVSFIRSIDSREIYMSPLSYGVAPFSINKTRRSNPITLKTPDELLAGSPLTISYRSEKPGKIVVFAVDEGILQVAKYLTPDPLGHFFMKRALEVQTSQILDLILPEFSIVQALSAAGGGAGGELERNLNPFKRKNKPPVVYWSGIIDSDPTERSVVFKVPDYFNGTLRVMAVAVSEDSIGVREAKTVVRSHFVLSPSVPPVVTPNDEFRIGVVVMNDLKVGAGTSQVKVECAASGQFELIGNKAATLGIERRQEKAVFFDVRVKNSLGSGTFTFTASSGGFSSRMEEGVSIRPAVPYRTELVTGVVSKADAEAPLARAMHPEFRSIQVAASYLPLGMSFGLKKFLDSYPYGCTEQIVSRAFPVLALKGVREFGVTDREVRDSLASAQAVLKYRQNQDGSIGLWAANPYVSDFITSYAMHYLTEAKEGGYPVDAVLFDRGLANLRGIAAGPSASPVYEKCLAAAYAVYVLTRNGAVTTGYINGLESVLERQKNWKASPISVYLAGAYALMKKTPEARAMLRDSFSAKWDSLYECDYYSFLSQASLALFIASRHMPEVAGIIGGQAIERIVDSVTRSKYNTISSSYAILALTSYSTSSVLNAAESLHLFRKTREAGFEEMKFNAGTILSAEVPYGSTEIRISNQAVNPVYYQVVQSGFDLEPPAGQEVHGMEAFREYTDLDGKTVGTVSLGQEIRVHVKIRTTDANIAIDNVAIVDLLPSGFELAYDRASDRSVGSGSLPVEYAEPREDRVLIFCRVANRVQEYVYTIRAVNRGKFAVPPVFAEAMYDRTAWTEHPSEGFIVVND